jgi:hypothetical protein
MSSSITAPFSVFNNLSGSALENGYIYIGTANLNPVTSPIPVFWDEELTQPAAQPIRTIGGFFSRSGSPARVYASETNYSILVKTSNGETVYSELNATVGAIFEGYPITPSQLATIPATKISFVQDGEDATSRTAESKLREIVSVKDFGAVGDGIADDTAAFLAAGKGAFVPAGDYVVDASQLKIQEYTGSGNIITNGTKAVTTSLVSSQPLVQKKMMEPLFGFYNGTTDTQIYDDAQFAPQGLTYYRDPETQSEYVFISQSVGGTDWAADEKIRIVQFELKSNESIVEKTVFTDPLTSSHAHLSTYHDGTDLYLYTSATAPSVVAPQFSNYGGKGWNKIKWKAGATADSDITTFRVFGTPNVPAEATHKYVNYGKGCVCLTNDGKYVIINAVNYVGNAGGRTMFVYDREQVEALSNKLEAEPVFKPVTLEPLIGSSVGSFQGGCSDGTYYYALYGSTGAFDRRGIVVYTLQGEKVRSIYLDGPAGQYTTETLLNNTTPGGFPASFEPEGITLYGDQLLVNFVDFFRNSPDVVTWEGKNWASVLENTVGRKPGDNFGWVETTKAATAGPWQGTVTAGGFVIGGTYKIQSVGTTDFMSIGAADNEVGTTFTAAGAGTGSGTALRTYTIGTTTRRSKTIYAVKVPTGAIGEQPLSSVLTYSPTVGDVVCAPANIPNVSFLEGETFRISAYQTALGRYRDAIRYSFDQRLDVFDTSEGANQNYCATLRMDTVGDVQATLYGQDGTSANSAYLQLKGRNSSSDPNPDLAGEARLSSCGTAFTRLQVGGTTKLAVTSTEVICYQNTRPTTTNIYSLGTATRLWSVVYAGTPTINTSDARSKQQIKPLLEAEKAVALKCKGLLRTFKFNDAVEKKGDEARIHVGIIAQDLAQAFQEEGLDPSKYAMFCHDEWPEQTEEGVTTPAGDRYGIRYSELLAFIIAAL